jgi:hypothetical protein
VVITYTEWDHSHNIFATIETQAKMPPSLPSGIFVALAELLARQTLTTMDSDLSHQLPVGMRRLSHIGATIRAINPIRMNATNNPSRICDTGISWITFRTPIFHSSILRLVYLIRTTLRSTQVGAGSSALMLRKTSTGTE